VSTRIRNHETAVAKVNDTDGNPIEIAAVVVWQVEQAMFEVDDFVEFVAIQAATPPRRPSASADTTPVAAERHGHTPAGPARHPDRPARRGSRRTGLQQSRSSGG